MSTIKVMTILGFMIFAICVNAGVGKQGYLGFRYWVDPGAFAPYLVEDKPAAAKFVGFWATMIQASFSYQGTELVGIAAGETQNPRKNIPSAIRKTFLRILFFFVLTVFFIGIVVPYTNQSLVSGESNASASPFVIAANLAGVQVLPDIINAVLLTVVASAANSNVYSGSRIIVGLAQEGFAPHWFKMTTKHGVPYYSVAFTSAFGLLGFLNVSNAGQRGIQLANEHLRRGRVDHLGVTERVSPCIYAGREGAEHVARCAPVQGALATVALVVCVCVPRHHHLHAGIHVLHPDL